MESLCQRFADKEIRPVHVRLNPTVFHSFRQLPCGTYSSIVGSPLPIFVYCCTHKYDNQRVAEYVAIFSFIR